MLQSVFSLVQPQVTREDVAQLLADKLGHDLVAMHDIAAEGIAQVAEYDQLIMGIPTWDFGELQEDWLELWPELEAMDFTGKQVALFGLGDQIGYGEWFLDAMGLLHDLLKVRGAQLCGYSSVDGFTFEASKALTEMALSSWAWQLMKMASMATLKSVLITG